MHMDQRWPRVQNLCAKLSVARTVAAQIADNNIPGDLIQQERIVAERIRALEFALADCGVISLRASRIAA